jgi:hypothetical protein
VKDGQNVRSANNLQKAWIGSAGRAPLAVFSFSSPDSAKVERVKELCHDRLAKILYPQSLKTVN